MNNSGRLNWYIPLNKPFDPELSLLLGMETGKVNKGEAFGHVAHKEDGIPPSFPLTSPSVTPQDLETDVDF